jgi:hypothetical protein
MCLKHCDLLHSGKHVKLNYYTTGRDEEYNQIRNFLETGLFVNYIKPRYFLVAI